MPHASAERVGVPGADGLFVEVGFENSNPPRAEFVAADEEGTLVVRQFLEDGAPEGYSFHLNVAFFNVNGYISVTLLVSVVAALSV